MTNNLFDNLGKLFTKFDNFMDEMEEVVEEAVESAAEITKEVRNGKETITVDGKKYVRVDDEA